MNDHYGRTLVSIQTEKLMQYLICILLVRIRLISYYWGGIDIDIIKKWTTEQE